MVNANVEQLLTLKQLAERVPLTYKTLHAHVRYGHNGVKLEASNFGGKLVTTMEAVQRFIERCDELKSSSTEPPAPPVPARVTAADRHKQEVRRRLREEHGL